MQRKTVEWIAIGHRKSRLYFFYGDKVLDLTEFAFDHPGGEKALRNYVFKDVTEFIFTVYPHRKESTLKVLLKYTIGTIPESEFKEKNGNKKDAKNNDENPKKNESKSKRKVCFNKDFLPEEENVNKTPRDNKSKSKTKEPKAKSTKTQKSEK